MKNISRIFISVLCVLLCVSMLFCIVSCDDTEPVTDGSESKTEESTSEKPNDTEPSLETGLNYDDLRLEDYVSAVTYKGMNIVIDDADATKEEELWDTILQNAVIAKYPEDKVDYFFNQTKKAYMYIVNGDEEDYELLLKNRGTDENKMRDEAKELVKKDLVYYYIVRAENIRISEKEVEQLFDKYVDKYVQTYGYNREYVFENMTEIIYDSMLYDKTMEFLISINNITYDTNTTDTQQKRDMQP